MKKFLFLGLAIFLLTTGSESFAQAVGVIEFRGNTRIVSTNCTGLPSLYNVNMRLSWANYVYHVVKDRQLGISLDGYPVNGGVFLQETYPLQGGGKMIAGYTFDALDKKKKTARLTQIYIFEYPGGRCSARYRGNIQGR